MKRPRLNILRTFEAAGRRLSFSLAAEELHISPPAVSQQIRQLEAYLEARLFVRRHRGLSLTGTGRAYLDAVHEALERLDAVTDQLFPGSQEKSVIIRCTPSVATLWLAPRLGRFHKIHPLIDLSIRTLDQELAERGATGTNLEIVAGEPARRDGWHEKLLRAAVVPVCSPRLLAGGDPLGRPEALTQFELIHVLGYDEDWHRWLQRFGQGYAPASRGLSVDGSLIAIEAAQRGDGVMLGRRPFIDQYLESGELVDVFAGAYPLYADYYLRGVRRPKAASAGERVMHWLMKLGEQAAEGMQC